MKSFTSRNPVTVALVGFATAALVLVVVFNFSSLPLVGSGSEYKAEFTDASGLKQGEEVRIAGIKVGEVTEVDLDGAHVLVSFTAKEQTLGKRTRAGIEIKTLLGQHYLAVSPAGSGALDAGATIPESRTSSPSQIVPTLQHLSSTAGKIDTDQVAKAFNTLSDVLDNTSPQIRQTLQGLSALSRTIASRDSQIRQLFSRAHRVTGAIASTDRQIDDLIDGSNEVLTVLHNRRDAIHRLLTGTNRLAQQLTGLVTDNKAQLKPALDHLHQVVSLLQHDKTQLDKLLGQLPPYVRVFTNLAGTGPYFDAGLTAPRNFALCDNGSSSLTGLLDSALSATNKKVNGNTAPCLPLGPAAKSGGHP